MNDTKEMLYLAMARGIFMGLADIGDMDALFPEVNGDWHSAMNNPEKITTNTPFLVDGIYRLLGIEENVLLISLYLYFFR